MVANVVSLSISTGVKHIGDASAQLPLHFTVYVANDYPVCAEEITDTTDHRQKRPW
jgi:hypothetical protein